MNKTKDSLKKKFAQGPRVDLSGTFSKKSGVALLFCGDTDNLELLFIKRATNPRDSWSGQLAFPGGKMEESDSTLLDACLREVHEEIGLQLPLSSYVGSLDDLQARKRGILMGFYIQPFIFYLDHKPDVTLCASEVAATEWVSLTYLRDQKNNAEYVYEKDGAKRNLPGIRFSNGDILWGLTYMMVLNLFQKLDKN